MAVPRRDIAALVIGHHDWFVWQPPAWYADALCAQVDPEPFFPDRGGSVRDAKKVCASCDVRERCLEYALDNGERWGIWGGKSERDRRKLERLREAS